MKIGILGSGLMGAKIGSVFAQLGHEVIFSYSRSEDKLHGLAKSAGKGARAGKPREVALESDVIVLAVHWSRLDDALSQAGDLGAKIVLSCTNPPERQQQQTYNCSYRLWCRGNCTQVTQSSCGRGFPGHAE